jgi:hypothetical protein
MKPSGYSPLRWAQILDELVCEETTGKSGEHLRHRLHYAFVRADLPNLGTREGYAQLHELEPEGKPQVNIHPDLAKALGRTPLEGMWTYR